MKNMNNEKYDFNDITLVPSILSSISSRSEIELDYLPLIVAPMDTVVDKNNLNLFLNENYEVAFPRNEEINDEQKDDVFISLGLKEAKELLDKNKLPKKVLIDVANGHMLKLWELSKEIKEKKPNTILMVGNIANPNTYLQYAAIGVDFIRVGIGAGKCCTTSANSSIHYPMASLVKECKELKEANDCNTKIVADGGFKNFDEIIKALALGADYVMIGGILNKCIESCAPTYLKLYNKPNKIKLDDFNEMLNLWNGNSGNDGSGEFYKSYRGMSTKEVQRKWGNEKLKTSEGISLENKVEYSLHGWTDNFISYLKTSMSYTNKKKLSMFIGNVETVFITESAQKRYRK